MLAFLALAGMSRLPAPGLSIIVQPGATKAEISAANRLQHVLGLNTKVVTSDKPTKFAIIIGQGKLAKRLLPHFHWKTLKPEGVLIRTVGTDLVIAGGRPRGTQYAVTRYLAQAYGYRAYAPWAISMKPVTKIKLQGFNISETPAFEYREAYWNHTQNRDFALGNFSNGASADLDETTGGKITYQGFVHTYYGLVPPEKYFATHPEWYSLIDGKRTTQDAQLCTTNPELRDFVVEQVRQQLRANPTAHIVSVSQNDCFKPCQCEKCRTLVKQEGSEAALVLDLANYVAAKIKDEFPEVAVDTLAYQWSRHPTLHMRPLPNVIVRLCSIECNFAEPLNAPVNAAFAQDLEAWNKLTNRLYIWDYCTNFAQYMQPQPDYFALGPTLRWFSEHGVKGVFEEGDYTSSGGDMAELKAWLIDQMLWNPKQDPDKLIDDFLNGYYGKAARPIKAYLNLMSDEAKGTYCTFYLGPEAKFLRYENAKRARQLWVDAAKLVKDTPTFAARVQRSALSFQYVWLVHWNEYRQAAKAAGDSWPLPEALKETANQWLAAWNDLAFPLPGYPTPTAVNEGGRSPEEFVHGLLN